MRTVPAILLTTLLPALLAAAGPSSQPTTARFAGVHLKNDDDGGYEVRLTVGGRPHVRSLDPYEEETLPGEWEQVEVKVVDQPPLVARRGEFIVIKNGQLFRHTPQGP